MEFFRFYCGAIVFAWLGNVAYAFSSHDTMLGFWSPLPVACGLILFTVVHATRRYGTRGVMAYFGIVVSIAWAAETIGVLTGMPFGAYRYAELMQPFVGEVPLSVLFAYFAMSYPAWTAATAISGRFDHDCDRHHMSKVAAIAALLMVFWDLSMDPLRATIEGRWIWQEPGRYLGIPAGNFVGWFVVSFVMFRAFGAWVLANRRTLPRRPEFRQWPFWAAGAMIYLSFCGEYLLRPLIGGGGTVVAGWSGDKVLSGAALATLLTMLPAGLLAMHRARRILGPYRAARLGETGARAAPSMLPFSEPAE